MRDMRTLPLELGDRSYNIYIQQGLIDDAALISKYLCGDNVLVLSNEIIAPLYFEKLAESLGDKQVFHYFIRDGEEQKNLQNYSAILDFLITHKFRRNDTLVALGGGVIGDLGGFVAASYQRGMRFLQVPTSLLAQVDSSVGGKTAVNHPQGKNMVGAFYQPKAVFVDTASLSSLPSREYFSGFAEIVKYAALGCVEIEQLLTTKMPDILARELSVLEDIIYYSCLTKAKFVAADEKEQGSRALLNLGHTFGHALERVTSYKKYLHGEAVSIGTMMAFNMSLDKGLIDVKTRDKYQHFFTQLKLPTKVDFDVDVEELIDAMTLDKKNLSASFRLVLPQTDSCIIVEESDRDLIKKAIVQQLE